MQALHLMNSPRLHGKIASPDRPGGAARRRASGRPREIVEELYLLAYVAVPPTDEETRSGAGAFFAEGATRQSATEDLLWALINSAEFVFND